MTGQLHLSSTDFTRSRKQLKREKFLSEMERLVPWKSILRLIEPVYAKAGNGRQPYAMEQMLRIYCLQLWYNLSDPLMEEMLYDSRAMSEFAGIDLVSGKAPDETTIGNFRRLVEEHKLGEKIFSTIGSHLKRSGIAMSKGTIVDATIITAASSTKNSSGKRDEDMHQTKKGNQWYFGMKAHIGVDADSKMIHSIEVTPANAHDSTMMEKLLRKSDEAVWGDKAYAGTSDKIHRAAPKAEDKTMHKARRNTPLTPKQTEENHQRSKVRSRVEHCFGVMKNIFGFRKVRYRGLAKNTNRVFMTCALINIYLARTKLLQPA